MPHSERRSDIISLDLSKERDDTLDMLGEFPLSETHAVSTEKPLVDGMSREKKDDINIHTPQSVRMMSTPDITTLDMVPADMS
jgi:hypothetical protein